MSAFTIDTPRRAHESHWLNDVRDWLRHARIALRPAHSPLGDLPESALRDVAARQTDIGRLLDREKNWILQASLTRAHSRLPDQF